MKGEKKYLSLFVIIFFVLNGSIYGQVTPEVTWPEASSIVYGQKMSDVILTGGSAQDEGETVAGEFVFDSPFDDPDFEPDADTYDAPINFIPDDQETYETVSSTIELLVNKAPAKVELSNLLQTYDGDEKPVTVTTIPEGLAVTITYDGSPTIPINADTYLVEATIVDNNYEGTASDNLVIQKATATVTLSDLVQTYDGTEKPVTVTTDPEGLALIITYDGLEDEPVNVGTYAVVATVNDTNYEGTASDNLVIQKATATVTLSDLVQTYDGTEKPVTVTTDPIGLSVVVTYDGLETIPIDAGTYALVATVDDDNYEGEANGTLQITPLTINVTADALSKTYGDVDPELTFGFAPELIGDDTFTGELEREAGEDVGFYEIEQGSLSLSDNYTIAFTGADFEITTLEITVTVTDDQSKTYGDVDPELTFGFAPDLIGEDSFTGSLERDAGEDVGFYEIEQGTLSLSDNYTIAFTGADFEITPLEITVTATEGQGKTYGDVDPELTFGFAPELIGDDTFTGELEREAGEDVGFYDIEQGTLSLSDNYTLIFTEAEFTITELEIRVIADSQEKIYGEADPELTFIHEPELVADDTFSGEPVREPGEDVGTYSITQGTLSLSSNYILVFIEADFEITKALLTITATNITKTVGVEYVFDGTEFTTDGLVENGADEVTSVTLTSEGADADAEIGTYDIEPSDAVGVGLTNYDIDYVSGIMDVVDKITLNLTGIVAEDKEYDGTTDVIISNYGTLTGVEDGDEVSIDETQVTASFNNKNAGTGKTVTLSNIQLIGSDAEKYTIGNQTTTADITPATLTLSDFIADSKTYDGTTDVTGDDFEDDRIGDDELVFTYDVAFEDADAGIGKTVNFTNIEISGGADQGNYTLDSDEGTAIADIEPLEITVTVTDDQSKTYGDVDPELTFGFAPELIGDDTFTGELEREAGEDVGFYEIEQGSLSLSDNYILDFEGAEFEITPASLTITAEDESKVYGDDDPVFTVNYDGFVGNEDENDLVGTLEFTRAHGEDVGEYAITPSGLTSSNYDITFEDGILQITPASLTITADDQTKLEGEEFTFTGLEFTISVLVAGDEVTSATITSDGAQADALPGTYPIVISDAVGVGLTNYDITYVEGTFTVEEDPDVLLTIQFGQGFTWFSINVDPGSLELNDLFADLEPCTDDRIRGQTNFASFFNDQWFGTLLSIDVNRGYVMSLCTSQQIEVEGTPVPPTQLNLGAGFTWLGYTPQVCLPINEALANISPEPTTNDRFIGQGSFSTYLNGQWIGTLTQLCPGNRYTIALANASIFQYPANPDKSMNLQTKSQENHRKPDILPLNMRHTMTIIGQLKDPYGMISLNENDIVYAIIGEEERGIARPLSENGGLIFLSVASNHEAGELIRFLVWKDDLQQYFELKQTLTYETLKAIGTAGDPFIFTMAEPLGPDTFTGRNIAIGDPYPNPTNNVVNIPYFINGPAEINFYLYSNTGNLMQNLRMYQEMPGEHKIVLEKGYLPPGVYYYQVIINSKIKTLNKNGTLVIVK